jgi:hypothetical protein
MDTSGEEDDFSSGDHNQGTTNDDHLHRLDSLKYIKMFASLTPRMFKIFLVNLFC